MKSFRVHTICTSSIAHAVRGFKKFVLDNRRKGNYPIGVSYTYHANCFACGAREGGLGLAFRSRCSGVVVGECTIDDTYQGYEGVVQGGIVATVLDCAMTNCLFADDIQAMTARLDVRFSEPVLVGEELTVEARLVGHRGPVFELEAEIIQCGSVRASAKARLAAVGGTYESSCIGDSA